jgi:hypothetical protein
MSRQQYTAAKTRSQGRSAWAISFRHPAKPDPRTNSGMKVRRGLGTSNDQQADLLVSEMNALLADESWWSVTQRDRASHHFSPAIVAAFYDPLEPELQDTTAIRERYIPMPDHSAGYSRVLFVGTTGAGKTSLLRHIIGSDPKRDRFPSTSTSRTTIADIEIISGKAPYEAVVTFFDEWRIHTYVVECVVEAGLAVWNGRTDDEIAERLLEHSDQRFRLSYILGSWRPEPVGAIDDEWSLGPVRPESDDTVDDEEVLSADKRLQCQAFLQDVIKGIRETARGVITDIVEQFGDEATDPTGNEFDAYQDLFEAEFEASISFDEVVKDIVDEVRLRFDEVKVGEILRRKSGWPEVWRIIEEDRDEFVKQIRWFSSNYAKAFGRLLTPLVDGIRIKGPLHPTITGREDQLVLIDGQGLGHTPDPSASITTHITSRFSSVDVILLVDNAEQPMQAASLAAIRAVVSSGYQRKLAVAFTHFDQVKGDNLPGAREKRAHVMASVRNGLSSFKDMGQIALSSLQRNMEDRCFMLGYLDYPSDKLPKGFVIEFERLLTWFGRSILPTEAVDLSPAYDISGVAFAVQEAARDFNRIWSGRLGLPGGDGYSKEHWTRIKALTRRFAQQWKPPEYKHLMPIPDLVSRLEEAVLRFLEKPISWSRRPTDEDEAEAVLSLIRQDASAGFNGMARTRIADTHLTEWVMAYNHRGAGSTFDRAREVMNIYEAAAPIPGAVIDRVTVDFLRDVRGIVRKAVEDNGGSFENP